jgi:excinuclease ABC subunit B
MTNSKLENFNEFSIFPAKHFVTTRENLNRSMDDIRSELSGQLKLLRSQDKLLEAQRLEQRTLYDLEMMAELGYCSGVENYSMHLDGRSQGERPNTLIDFFPDDYLLFIDESHVSIPQVRAMYNGDRARKDSLITHGFRLPSAYDNRPMKFEEFEKSLNKVIFVSATPAEYELQNSNGVIVEQIIRPTGLLDPVVEVKSTEGQIDYLISEINKTVQNNERVLVTTLTKKMAEDLTDYLRGVGIRSEYMHSEVDTIERINILRGLRMQEFDVLVGINLLREGLDLPEVSLVAVLDADKEGFLRSKSSLLQVSGRAARNINGRVLLFGDKITASMENLIKETDRRRLIQKKYNQENSITPQTITKSLEEVKQSTMIAKESPVGDSIKIDEDNIDGVELNDLLEKLNRKMLACAKKMQFEEAAMLRDKINKIKEGIENDR